MSNPFAEHAQNTADYHAMLKGDDGSGGATLTFPLLPGSPVVDCTFERIIDNFDLVGGQSSKLMVEGCKFLASGIPAANLPRIRKGLQCVLLPNPSAAPVALQLWSGGMEQGGLIFNFVLVSLNYSA